MSFADSFLSMMNTVVSLEAFLGTTGNNQRSYGTLRYYRAYIDESGTLFRTAQGQQIVDSASVYLHPQEVSADGSAKNNSVRLTTIHQDARLGIPDPNQASGWAYPVILKIDGLHDEAGLVMFVCHT